MPEKEPYKGVAFKTVSAVTNEVSNFHNKSDVDSGSLAQHHTLGGGVNQAAPGNHGNVLGDMKQSFQTANHRNWLLLNGQAVSRTTWSKLFAMWGTTYGAGDGSTTFNLPDVRDAFLIGASATKALGTTGGSNSKTITSANLPTHTHAIDHDHAAFDTAAGGSHNHTINESHATGTGSSVARGTSAIDNVAANPINANTHIHNIDVPAFAGNSGNGGFANTAMDVTPKYLALNCFVWGS